MTCKRIIIKICYRLRSANIRFLFFTVLGVSSCLLLWMSYYFSLRIFVNIVIEKSAAFHQLPEVLFSITKTAKGRAEYNTSGIKCVHPELDPYDPAVMQFYQSVSPVTCSAMKDWVYVTNGTFRISSDALKLHGDIVCDYTPIRRNGDFRVHYGKTFYPMLDGTPLTADFFRVNCESSSGKKYTNTYAAVARNAAVMERLHKYHSQDSKNAQNTQTDESSFSQSVSKHNLSVFMFGFDSLSRMSWVRLLRKTRRYYLEKLGGIELEGYNTVGDGTPSALTPILIGKLEEELPEARKGFPGATVVDSHPWIWNDFSKQGYVTAWAEDMASTGTFQYRLLGFKDSPTDHYMRPFYLATEVHYGANDKFCLGSTPRHINFMNWFGQLFDMYKDFPKFFFGFHSELSHDSNNPVQGLDEDLVAFLQDLERKGHLNSTVLILMADHGARFDFIRATAQGKLEERLPYFSFRFPPWFHRLYPNIIRNMRTNVNRLTTPYDIHATFHDILNYSSTNEGDVRNRAISLLKEIPKERTCSQARVAPHWCTCVQWQEVSKSHPLVTQAVDSIIKTINRLTEAQRKRCAQLTFYEITKSARYIPNSSDRSAEWTVLNYNNESAPSLTHLYQVSFKTLPGQGHFEVTCQLDVKTLTFKVNTKQISRINKYGSQPACIQKRLPHLRPYCYCV